MRRFRARAANPNRPPRDTRPGAGRKSGAGARDCNPWFSALADDPPGDASWGWELAAHDRGARHRQLQETRGDGYAMRKLAKYLVLGLTYLLVLPAGLSSRLLHQVARSSFLFDLFAQLFALMPGLPGRYIRACFYQQALRRAHLDLDIGFASIISKIDTEIGRRVLITGHTTIGRARIGDGAVIANYVSILSGRYQHNFTDPTRAILAGADSFSELQIGAGSFIGEHCVVMADIGDFTIVGAGSVVVKPLPGHVVAVGNPARVVKERNSR